MSNFSYNKNFLQKLCQACQHAIQQAISLKISGSNQSEHENCRQLTKNEQIQKEQQQILEQINKSMRTGSRGYVRIQKLLNYKQIRDMIGNDFPLTNNKREQNLRLKYDNKTNIEDQICFIKIAVSKYSKKLWANYQYVRLSDPNQMRQRSIGLVKQFKIVYVQNLEEGVDQNDIIHMLKLNEWKGLDMQYCKQDNLKKNRHNINSTTSQDEHQNILKLADTYKKFKVSIKKQKIISQQPQILQQIEQDQNKEEQDINDHVISAQVYYCPYNDSAINMPQINAKVKDIKDFIFANKPHIQYQHGIRIFSAQQQQDGRESYEEITLSMNKLRINPYIQHHQLGRSYGIFDEKNKNISNDMFQYKNTLLFS